MKNSEHAQLPTFIRRTAGKGNFSDQGFGIHAYQPIVAAWILETVLMFKLYAKTSARRLPDLFDKNSAFTRFTGFSFPPGVAQPEEDCFGETETLNSKWSNRQIAVALRAKRLDWDKRKVRANQPLIKNIEGLGRHLGLSDAEKAVLFFAMFNDAYNPFDELLNNWTQRFNNRTLTKLLARLTGFKEAEISAALHPEASLARTGLVAIDNSLRHLENKLDLMPGMATILNARYRSDARLLARFMTNSKPGNLTLDDFEHLRQDIETLRHYLAKAVTTKEKGVNILFYGPPGTGKTELAKALAKNLGLALFEVTYKGSEGEVLEGSGRLKAYSFCQRILERSSTALVMFDEVEDVFSSGSSLMAMLGLEMADRTGKAWINRIMESNPVPSLWITNNADIDPAYLRRFDYSIHFPKPPKQIRLTMARRHLGKLASDETWLSKIANHEEVSPAQFQTAAKVARLAGRNSATRRELAERTLERSMRLLGQKRRSASNCIYTGYDLSLINADHDLVRLSAGLKRIQAGSLCFYGPPGTGKSQFAHYLAEVLGRPIALKRASDLMSKWVGETEKLISRMFEEARESEAILLLDEADSFLRDRRGARAQWEVSQVNELLTQMEAFDGIFICTTNLMENLDQASLRRFAFKIKLDYLRPDQRITMFTQEFCRSGGSQAEAAQVAPHVRQLDRLTPGDFAVVMRQLQFLEERPSADTFLALLRRESAAKGNQPSIGFLSQSQ